MAIEIIEYDDVCVFRFGPVLTWDDLMALFGYYAQFTPPLAHLKHELVDLRQTQKGEIDYQKMTDYLNKFMAAPADFKVAIVVAAPLTFGYARMFQILSEPVIEQVEIFKAMAPALDWLAVSEATRQAVAD